MEVKHNVFRNYLNNWFVETGSYAGDGVQSALDAGFKNIISFDVAEYNYNLCVNRFSGHGNNVMFVLADSALDLWRYIDQIQEPITFWLDAHWSGEGSPSGLVKNPLLYELNQIRRHAIKTHTILIDDVRCWRGETWARDFSLENVIDTLLAINPAYKIGYVDGSEPNDVLTATI